MNRLFLICPDCYLEVPLRKIFGENSFFLTALGIAFDLDNFETLEEVNQFIMAENINEIVLVNDHQCTFVKSAIKNEIRFNTKAEKILIEIANSDEDIKSIENETLKCKQISKVNLKRLAYELTESAFIGNKINDGEIVLKGIIFNRADNSIQETTVLN